MRPRYINPANPRDDRSQVEGSGTGDSGTPAASKLSHNFSSFTMPEIPFWMEPASTIPLELPSPNPTAAGVPPNPLVPPLVAGFPLHGIPEEPDLSFPRRDDVVRTAQDQLETVEFVGMLVEVTDLIPGDDNLIGDVSTHMHQATARVFRVDVREDGEMIGCAAPWGPSGVKAGMPPPKLIFPLLLA